LNEACHADLVGEDNFADMAGLAIELDRLDRGSAVAMHSGDRIQINDLVEQILG
jgi:hypothetical protein